MMDPSHDLFPSPDANDPEFAAVSRASHVYKRPERAPQGSHRRGVDLGGSKFGPVLVFRSGRSVGRSVGHRASGTNKAGTRRNCRMLAQARANIGKGM